MKTLRQLRLFFLSLMKFAKPLSPSTKRRQKGKGDILSIEDITRISIRTYSHAQKEDKTVGMYIKKISLPREEIIRGLVNQMKYYTKIELVSKKIARSSST